MFNLNDANAEYINTAWRRRMANMVSHTQALLDECYTREMSPVGVLSFVRYKPLLHLRLNYLNSMDFKR